MEGQHYIFKEVVNGEFQNTTSDLISLSYVSSSFSQILDNHYIFPHSRFLIPNFIVNKIQSLLNEYNLSDFNDDILSFIVHSQEMYIVFEETYLDDLINVFIDEDKEYLNLLNIIEEFLFAKNKLTTINFKFQIKSDKILSVKNSNVIGEILKSLCEGLDISKENFHQLKEDFINSKMILHEKGGTFVFQFLIKSLFNFLSKNHSFSENQILKFIGEILNIAQLGDESQNLEYQFIRNYVLRDIKIFSKLF